MERSRAFYGAELIIGELNVHGRFADFVRTVSERAHRLEEINAPPAPIPPPL